MKEKKIKAWEDRKFSFGNFTPYYSTPCNIPAFQGGLNRWIWAKQIDQESEKNPNEIKTPTSKDL